MTDMNLFIAFICTLFAIGGVTVLLITFHVAIAVAWLNFKWRFNLRRENFQVWVVWRLPRWVIRWAVVRATVHATAGRWSGLGEHPSAVTYETIAKRWERA